MPPSVSTFLAYLDKNSPINDSNQFAHKIFGFLELKYPDLEFSIFQHLYAPESFISEAAKESDAKYLKLLNNRNHRQLTEYGEFLKSNGLLLFPLTDHTNQVKYVIVLEVCPNDIIDDLSVVVREIKAVFRFVSAQIENTARSIDLRMANLVSRISHDLNSLIALIPNEVAKEETLNARIKYSEILSREIMFYLREMSVDKSHVPIIDLFTGITSVISMPEKVTFNLKFIEKFDSLTVDVELIDRAISEIIMNAVIAASIEGGEVEMIVGKRQNVSPFIKYDWLEIRIKDSGPGIAREFLEEIRNPFFTTWKEQGHIGLGLSIAEKIIQAHDGYIDIKSIQEKGAVVTIYLPLY